MNEIKKLIAKFASDLTRAIEDREKHALAAVRAGIMTGLAVGGANVSPTAVAHSIAKAAGRSRRKGPLQLCPIPGCKSPAAPVFSMLCGKHRNTPKRLVAKYRAARRAKKADK